VKPHAQRWRIALAILALYALVIWYIAQADKPVPIAPRTYHCNTHLPQPCLLALHEE
jgi:hypothetical protein